MSRPCNPPKGKMSSQPKSPLAKAVNPAGRVDLLFARLFEEGVKASRNPLVADAYAQMKPYLETALARKVGPRTRLGRKMARDLFAVKDALERLRRTA